MKMGVRAKAKSWLLPAVLILFLVQVILLPFAVRFTYAGRSESPHHVLTYTTGRLVWGSATGIDENGVARLDLFQSVYQNVQTENGDRLVAPGTGGHNIVRLKNDAGDPVRYTAVMYRIKEESTLPVAPELVGEGFADTQSCPLPAGVKQEQVVRAVTGTVGAGQIQDFDIVWNWLYYENDPRDVLDTALGNKAAFARADEVTAGLYIVVEEDPPAGDSTPSEDGGTNLLYPQVPQTGDNAHLTLYVALLIACGILLVLLTLEKRKEHRCERD